MYYRDKLYIIHLYIYLSGGDVMLGQCVRAKVVKPIGYKDESGYLYPLNFAQIYDTGCDEFAFILGIDHAVKNFDGRVIAEQGSAFAEIWNQAVSMGIQPEEFLTNDVQIMRVSGKGKRAGEFDYVIFRRQ